jgi:tetratricopeptide (TPR) repeat protein
MDQPEAMRPQADAEGSPSGGGPPAKTPSIPSALTTLPTVPDYDLLRCIGSGAYGDVWLARSVATGALRAAKLVWRNRFEDERPFKREFEGIQRFEQISREHPSQLALFHIGRNDPEGYFYYVMELADDAGEGQKAEAKKQNEDLARSAGTGSTSNLHPSNLEDYTPHTLRAELQRGRLPAARVLEIGLALAEALAHLHSNGLVHRDVKPSNVIFVNGRPKLADIGLVTDASDQCSIVGTEGYLPPEGPGTPQADIFALGKVLYEAATGMDRREFPKLPKNLRDWPDAGLVLELNEVVLRACAKEPDKRYATCQEMHDELALLERGKSVKRKRNVQSYAEVAKKLGVGAAVAAAIAVVVVILVRGVTPANSYPDGLPSTNLEAAALSDRGMKILRGSISEELPIAWTNFHKAIDLDPNFVQPYVGLVEMNFREHFPGKPAATRETWEDLANHLDRLAPRLAATHCAKSVLARFSWNQVEAEREALEAIKANPKYELGHTMHGWLLLCFGRTDEIFEELKKTQAISPSHVIVYWGMGNFYWAKRDFTNAMVWFRKALEWDPRRLPALSGMERCYIALRDYTNALNYAETNAVFSGRQDEASARRGHEILSRALERGGPAGYWQQHWNWEKGNTNQNFYWKATIQIHLGNTNAALGLLQQDYESNRRNAGDSGLGALLFDAEWDGLHDDPQFKKVLDEIGYTKVMRPRK